MMHYYKSRRKGVLLLIIFLILPILPVFSQTWITRHYTGLDGLASPSVYGITQDHLGRMWMATRLGISCYDGVSWKNYGVQDGLPRLSLSQVAVSPSGQIWAVVDPVQVAALEVVYFNDSRWNTIKKVVLDTVLPATISAFLVDEQNNQPVVTVGTLHYGVFRWEKGVWRQFTLESGLPSNEINGIISLDGMLYIATNNGLSVIDKSGKVDNRLNKLLGFPSKEIKGIYLQESRKYPDAGLERPRIWIFGNRYLGYFEESHPKAVCRDTGIQFGDRRRRVILQPDYRAGIYIANYFEVFYLNHKTGQVERVESVNGLISEGANDMFIDFEKNIWISCQRGVTKISSRRFSNYQMRNGLLEDEVTAILEYEPGKFALGHNKGITFLENNKFRKVLFSEMVESIYALCRVLDLKIDSKKNVWAALSNFGVARINPQGEVKWFGSPHGLPPTGAICLWIDPQDNIWVGSRGGLFMLEGNRFTAKNTGFPTITPRRLLGKNGKLTYIAGFGSGVYVRENNRWNNYRVPETRNANDVYALLEDSRGHVWVGSMDGLYILNKGVLKKFEYNGFEISRAVYFIIKAADNLYWFGTGEGVVRWDGTRAVTYSLKEGLIGQETNRTAAVIDRNGRLWIGTNRGLSIYDAAFDNIDAWNPPPRLSLLYADVEDRGIKLPLDRPITLDYQNNTLEFNFRGISFQDESAILFKHKLEGADKEWVKEHYPYKQKIRYSGLHPGNYRFHLKACNALGVWSDVVSSAEITILKPYYQQWWFFLVATLAAAFIIFGILRFFSTRRSAALLEELVKERTRQLQLTEKRYRDLFEDSRDVVFTTGTDGRFIDINPAGVELLGYNSREEVLAADVRLALAYSETERLTIRKEIIEKGYAKDFEMVIKRKNGEKVTVQITATPIPGHAMEDFLAVRGIARDITEKLKLQQQLEQAQKMEALGTLAGGIAHDFNNILAVIIGYLDLSIDELPDDPQLQRNIKQIGIAAERAKELVYQILTFSRRSSQERKIIKLSMVIEEALKLLRSSLPATIDIRRDIAADSGVVLADPTQMHQVMMNLCANAAHAMRDTGGILEVKLHEVYLDNDSAAAYNFIPTGPYLRLTVSDTGHGIPPDIIKRIFEPYFTTKKKGEGTGMGLAVIHGIVKAHGGEISVYSEPGKGTTFHVLLPAAPQAEMVPDEHHEEIPGGQKEYILFVDDEILLVDIFRKNLTKLGYSVIAENSSPSALTAFRREPDLFDLVITDFAMPHLTGIQLTEEIKKIRHDIPVIICTGYSESITQDQIRRLGITQILLKPVSRTTLARAIKDALKVKEKGVEG